MKLLTGRLKYNLQCRNQFETTKNILTCKNSPLTHTSTRINTNTSTQINKHTNKHTHTNADTSTQTNTNSQSHTYKHAHTYSVSIPHFNHYILWQNFYVTPCCLSFPALWLLLGGRHFLNAGHFHTRQIVIVGKNSPTSDFAQRRTLLLAK